MKILIAYFSRTGFTEKLIYKVKEILESKGNSISIEKIQSMSKDTCLGEICKDVHHYPLIFLSLFSKSWRKRYIAAYTQIEEDIGPLQYSDVSDFDMICVGGPKWAHVSYPVARYLREVRGLEGKRIGAVYTFGGPPLPVFELETMKESMNRIVKGRGASIVAHLGISSAYHELGIIPLFRIMSRIRFCKSIDYFKSGSDFSDKLTREFCDSLLTKGT
ncbi:MAG: hypothetical protein JW864_15050 [Spirochaetes bacterium]|nr:hypothetical protein [Spirochaetota bacterium]